MGESIVKLGNIGLIIAGTSAISLVSYRLIRGYLINRIGNVPKITITSTNEQYGYLEGKVKVNEPIVYNGQEMIICIDKTYYRTLNSSTPNFVCKTIQYNDNVFIGSGSGNENGNGKIKVWELIKNLPYEPIDIQIESIDRAVAIIDKSMYEQSEIPITHIEHRFYGIKNNIYYTIFGNYKNNQMTNDDTSIIVQGTKDEYINGLYNDLYLKCNRLAKLTFFGLAIYSLSLIIKSK